MEQVAPPARPGRPAPLSGYLWEGKKRHGSRIVHPPGMLEFLVLLLGAVRAGLRARDDLAAENLLLRHQLAVVARPTCRRPRLRGRDKLLWVLARRLRPGWRRHLVLVRRRRWSAGIAQRGSCSGAGSLAPPRPAPPGRRGARADRRDVAGQPALGHRAHPRRAAEVGDRGQQPVHPVPCGEPIRPSAERRSGPQRSPRHPPVVRARSSPHAATARPPHVDRRAPTPRGPASRRGGWWSARARARAATSSCSSSVTRSRSFAATPCGPATIPATASSSPG